jgi:PAS domain S-box-containing protein
MKWVTDQPLRRQLQLTLGLVLVLVIAETTIACWTVIRVQGLHQQAEHSTYVIARANEALKSLIDIETGYRGFLLSGDESFLEPYASGGTAYADALRELTQATADDPAQVARWQDLAERATRWQQEVTQPGIALRRQVTAGGSSVDEVGAYVASLSGKRQMDAMRQEFVDAIAAEQQRLDEDNALAGSATSRLIPLLLGSAAVAFLAGVLGTSALAGSVVGGLTHLASAAQRIADGDLEQRVGLRRKDELGRAAAAFDRMADRLQETIEQSDSILAAAGEGIVGLNHQDGITFVNAAAARMLGYTPEELLGRSLHSVAHHSRADGTPYPRESCPLHAVRSSGGIQRVDNEVLWRKDGTAFPAEYVATPVRDPNGQQGAVVLFQDITARRQAEAEVARQRAELERSNRELQDFASVASHDLQEPLRKVQAFGDRLNRKFGDQLGPDGRDYLGRMQQAAGRMQVLINDLLTFSRVTTRGEPFRPTDLQVVVRQVVEDLETRIEQSGASVELNELPTLEADPLQMRQLFQNLIGNALKFRRPEVAPHVRVWSRPLGHAFEIAVEDNGIGFDEKYLDRIFTIFQRLHGRGEYEGTGVGLAVCRRIVERHGGTLTARSAPGQGATFLITLPAAQPRTAPEPASLEAAA